MSITVKKETMLFEKRGKNLLDGIAPQVVRFDGVDEPLTARMANPDAKPEYFTYINTDEYERKHIDIDGEFFGLVYDMGESKQVDFIYFACYNPPFESKEIEIYTSQKAEDIFTKESMLVSVDNCNGDAFGESFRRRGVTVETDGILCRYVAFKQNGTLAPDKISRICNFGAYCLYDNLKETYATGYYPNNRAPECSVQLKGDYKGEPHYLNDTEIFDASREVNIKNGEIVLTMNVSRKIDEIAIVGKKINTPKVASNGEFISVEYSEKQLYNEYNEYILNTEVLQENNIIRIELKDSVIDEVLLLSNDKNVFVDSSKVIEKDFIGLGGNVLPTHLFEISRMHGFNEAYMELEACRIKKTQPALVRIWFQIDWFIMDEQDYYNRKYTFNSPKMQAVLKELDAFKAAGSEIELNFGWKVGYTAQPWFCFQDVFNRRNSAPRDLDQFAIACADCLRELIINKGYDNIKYLTFYNESNAGHPAGYDFVCPEGVDYMLYWTEMLEKVDARLRKENLRHLVEIWAAEICNNIEEWAAHLDKNASDKYERYSYHKYNLDYDEAKTLAQSVQNAAGDRPISMTEFGCYNMGCRDKAFRSFELGNIECLIASINGGVSALAYWILSETCLDECGLLGGLDSVLWRFPTEDRPLGSANVSEEFYSMSMVTNYVPKHCKSIIAKADTNDMHTVAFVTENGDYTVLVESNVNAECSIKLNFDTKVNKKFYKHIYKIGHKTEANLIVPPVENEFIVDNCLKDTLSEGYSFIVYTTLPPVRQVVMDNVFVTVKAGESVKLSAKVVDGEGELKWSLCDTYCPTGYKGTITEDGVYTADESFYTWSLTEPYYAAKAELPTGEYGITIIKIVK